MTTKPVAKARTMGTKVKGNGGNTKPKLEPPRRGRKRGRCELSYCMEEVCMHCTCDGACGRGHAPKLCGKRRYEKRANCNQCKVSYYAIAKRKSPELLMGNHIRPPLLGAYQNMRPCPPLPLHLQHDAKWGSFTSSLNDGLPKTGPTFPPLPRYSCPPIKQPETVSRPIMPSREQLEKWRSFLMEEPATIVVWDDVKEAFKNKQDGKSSPMSNSSSEADLMSLAPDTKMVEVPPSLTKDSTPTTTTLSRGVASKIFERGDLKDPDSSHNHGSFSSVDDDDDDEEGFFDCMLDEMVDDNTWGIGTKETLKTEEGMFETF